MALNWECPCCHRRHSEKRKKCKCGYVRNGKDQVVWWVYVCDRGRMIRKRVGRDKDAAIALESSLKQKIAEKRVCLKLGKQVEDDIAPTIGITLEEFWIRYWKWCKMHNKNIDWKKSYWNKHIKPLLGRKFLNEITADDIRLLQEKKNQEGLSNATINRIVAIIRHMLNYAVKLNYLDKNPLQGKIDMLKESNDRWIYLTPQEVQKIKQYLSKTYHDLFNFLLYTGLRLGDALRLKWEDVNFEKEFIFVRGSKTKGGKDFSIPLNKEVIRVLENRLQQTKEKIEKKIKKKNIEVDKKDRIFKHSDSEFRRAFKRALEKAGLPTSIRIHDLRHTFASWLAMSGVPIQQIQMLLGHAEITMTLRYAHLNPSILKSASEAVVKFAALHQGRNNFSRNKNLPSDLGMFDESLSDPSSDSTLTYTH